MTHVSYYPGCTIKASAQQYEASALAVLNALDIQAGEMDNWNCCGVSHSLANDNLIRQVAPARILNRLHEQGSQEVVTFCDMCYNTLARSNRLMQQEPEKGAKINAFIDDGEGHSGGVEVLHLLQMLRDRVGFKAIKKKVKRPLKGLTVFPYYGCKLLRPGEVGIDDAEDPTILRDLMHALGAKVADDPAKIQCCGSHHVVNRDEIVSNRVRHIVARAREKGAQAIVLSCPLCQFNLDTRQHIVDAALPVFYFTQLMGLALGLDQQLLGLGAHHIDPLPLLEGHDFVKEGREV
jgi:heterodisulfide reductase subunit B